jgi:hypothetical protein
MFCRACSRGGLFVGLMRVETRTSVESDAIELELKGSYGLFSAEATTTFSEVTRRHDASVYCTLYAEGGPALQLGDPTDPGSLLTVANAWMRAMVEDPDRYARPLEWTLSPVRIADGPWPNAESVRHAQDVLEFCARERTELLDELNLLDWIREHPAWFSWAGTSVTLTDVDRAWRARQGDLDLLAACASAALDAPADAVMPAPYAAARVPAQEYRGVATPDPLPTGKPRPVPPGNQRDWRFCVKCHAMFFDGYAQLKGLCPGGGGHQSAGLNFSLAHSGDAA